ncbi:MAG: gliding motility-associated C-terminal domain-containing protein, partial [Flavobacteriales bacterium]|nr:gliding motility-associated C-terminal domain-containing protein [Flavobacteriales bacterium]
AYSVMVTDQCGSIAGGGLVMDVQDITAGFTLNYTGDYDVTFFNTSGPAPVQFLWDFGDGGTSSVMHPGHTYLDTEEHVVQLTVWNPIGCVDSTTALVRPTAHLYVPNAFTPDGDGVNDLFGPVGHDLFELEMRIYDRWGQVIYETQDPGMPWNGKVNGSGEVAQNGIYVYQIKATGRRFGPVEYVGHVALVK